MVAPVTETPDRNGPIVEPDLSPTEEMFIWMTLINDLIGRGFSGTITTAALTGGGVQGSMTFERGILVSQVQAT